MKPFLFGAVVALALFPSACGVEDSDPAAVVEDYQLAYNSGDIDAVMELFTEESVVTGHPFADQSEGLDAIRGVQIEDIASAAGQNAYTFSNVEVDGDRVTWDSQWVNDEGDRFCQTGHSAFIENDRILSWQWPSEGSACS